MNDRIGICIILSITIVCVTALLFFGICKSNDLSMSAFYAPIGLALVGGLTGISRGHAETTTTTATTNPPAVQTKTE